MSGIVLASASPRRTEILRLLGIEHEIDPSDADETIAPDWEPARAVRELAARKALSVSARRSGIPVLGADTIVVDRGRILGKPRDASEAEEMLAGLSGRSHEVHTGVALARGGDLLGTVSEITVVSFRQLASEEIRSYVLTGEPLDKAGAYGIQASGARLVARIEGCFYNVVGLPVDATLRLLDLIESKSK